MHLVNSVTGLPAPGSWWGMAFVVRGRSWQEEGEVQGVSRCVCRGRFCSDLDILVGWGGVAGSNKELKNQIQLA